MLLRSSDDGILRKLLKKIATITSNVQNIFFVYFHQNLE